MFDVVKYDSGFGMVEITPQAVKDYLVKGNGTVTDQEVLLFAKMCEAQKLNPFVTGEVYLIKFGSQPAQMVIGYDTYKRRAEENPLYLFKESGIIVARGNEVVAKAGACIYPTETLLGAWCRVHKTKGGREVVTYKEVGFDEYNKGNSIWKEKPCTMIEKVAISQALREAFPRDYEGLYTPEEIAPATYAEIIETSHETLATVDPPITQEQRKVMFDFAQTTYGKENGNELIKTLIKEEGLKSTTGMLSSTYNKIMLRLQEEAEKTSVDAEETTEESNEE